LIGTLTIRNCPLLVTLVFLRNLHSATQINIIDNPNLVDARIRSLDSTVPIRMRGNPKLCPSAQPRGNFVCNSILVRHTAEFTIATQTIINSQPLFSDPAAIGHGLESNRFASLWSDFSRRFPTIRLGLGLCEWKTPQWGESVSQLQATRST
jgi:hypothetical protein